MTGGGQTGADFQKRIDRHFAASADFWEDVYGRGDMESKRFRVRLERSLRWAEGLHLPAGARALDVGTGAGLGALSLAKLGLTVDAIDPIDEMVSLTREAAAASGLQDRVHVQLGDAHALSAHANTYDIVLALGVIPWLHHPERAVSEMARVLKPGGHLIVSAENRFAITSLLEPMRTPVLETPRWLVARQLRRAGVRRKPEHGPRARALSLRTLDALAGSAGLRKQAGQTYGFGPFSFLNRKLPNRIGVAIDAWLQARADSGVPAIRSAGVGYMILAKKVGPPNGGEPGGEGLMPQGSELTGVEQQQRINTHFAATSTYWTGLYDELNGESRRYWLRHERTIHLVDQLHLSPGARALDVGAGAGFTTIALAERGLFVDAIDAVPAMVEKLKERVGQSSVAGQVHAGLGDAHSLSAADATYDLVLALGVVPWLHSPATALAEMARVLKPGAWLIATSDNRNSLLVLFEPMHNPRLEQIRRRVARTLRRTGWRKSPEHSPRPRMESPRSFDRLLRGAGFRKRSGRSYGFGPFTFLNRHLPDRFGVPLDRLLQTLADARVPLIRSTGVGYLVLAQKTNSRSTGAPA